MHSYAMKIEMCNACLHRLRRGMIKMGFGFMHALASEEKPNSLLQPGNVCFLNIVRSSFYFAPLCFYLPFFPFVVCGFLGKGRGIERVGGRLKVRLFNTGSGARASLFSACYPLNPLCWLLKGAWGLATRAQFFFSWVCRVLLSCNKNE